MSSEHNTDGNTQAEQSGGFNPVRDIALVLSFLTRLPVGATAFKGRTLAQAAWAFPFAGLVVGGVGGGVLYGFAWMGWHAGIAVLLAMTFMTLVTGGLHEDGLADVADGFGGGSNREAKLEIMHDSRIGTYGVLALIFSVSIRAVALFQIQQTVNAMVVLVAAAVFSRAILPAVMAMLPHARGDGLSVSAGKPGGLAVLIALILGCGISFDVFYPDFLVPLVALGVVVLGVALLCLIAKRQIGGQTGDVIGAAQQIAETLFLVAVTIQIGGAL